MQMSYEEYLKATEKKQNNNFNSVSLPSYFSLKDDGDTAIVRFNISKIEDINVTIKHMVRVGGKLRSIECLRMPNESEDKCPLCASGNKANTRIYIKLLSYENEGDKVICKPCVWEQSLSFRNLLKSYIMDYGDLRNTIFKITRNGKKGDTQTRYSLIPANPQIYREENYPKDFSSFDSFDLNKYMLLKKSKEELIYLVENGTFPENNQVQSKVEPVNKENVFFGNKDVLKDNSKPIRTLYKEEDFTSGGPSPRRYTY